MTEKQSKIDAYDVIEYIFTEDNETYDASKIYLIPHLVTSISFFRNHIGILQYKALTRLKNTPETIEMLNKYFNFKKA